MCLELDLYWTKCSPFFFFFFLLCNSLDTFFYQGGWILIKPVYSVSYFSSCVPIRAKEIVWLHCLQVFLVLSGCRSGWFVRLMKTHLLIWGLIPVRNGVHDIADTLLPCYLVYYSTTLIGTDWEDSNIINGYCEQQKPFRAFWLKMLQELRS